MISIGFGLSLNGFEKVELDKFNNLKEKLHDNGVELYIENYFYRKSISFWGYDESRAFDAALGEFAEFCRNFLSGHKKIKLTSSISKISPAYIFFTLKLDESSLNSLKSRESKETSLNIMVPILHLCIILFKPTMWS